MKNLLDGRLYNALPSKKYKIACLHKTYDYIILCNKITNIELLSTSYRICHDVEVLGLEGNRICISYYPVKSYNVNIDTVRENESYNIDKYPELCTMIKDLGKPYDNIGGFVCTDLYDKDYMDVFKGMLKNNYSYFGYDLKDEELVYTFDVKHSWWWLPTIYSSDVKKSMWLPVIKKNIAGTGIASLNCYSFMYWYNIEDTKVTRIYSYDKILLDK
jgi:hypothetical protein